MVVGVTKPDGSVTTTVYDNAQRIVSTVEKTASNVVITGFEYTYDNLSRIIEEKHLADNTKICYTYDNLSRVTKRTVYNECNEIVSEENFTYDAAGNITDAPNSCFAYDTNNRLITFNGNTVSYDMDGNMLSNGYINCEFDSGNRLISAGGHTYTYNAEDVRIRNLCAEEDTTYTYDTNCRLSQLLCKTTNGITTKYVYGRGLIGEEAGNVFKTYHFDYRGSTIAITDASGNITDTFAYDTYGKLISRTGTSKVIFGYNGCDGVVTDENGLIYMKARYYSPAMKRFINADIVAGKLSNAVTLNRFAYANGNPVSNTDPFGLAAEGVGNSGSTYSQNGVMSVLNFIWDGIKNKLLYFWESYEVFAYSMEYELGIGQGIGFQAEVMDLGVKASSKETFFTVRKVVNEDWKVIKVQEDILSVGSLFAEFPIGFINEYNMKKDLLSHKEYAPYFNGNLSLIDVSGYFVLGADLEVSFNYDYYFEEMAKLGQKYGKYLY